jgi:hypothetical protein
MGLAMPTLGGSQGQTLAGAISTSTHGSDVRQYPFPDLVKAIHLITNDGQEMWVESSSDPITTDARLTSRLSTVACSDIRIIRDDELLHALQVSLGCFGVIYAYVLEVRTAFNLLEWTTESTWSEVSSLLLAGIDASRIRPPGPSITARNLLGPLIDSLPAPDGFDDIILDPHFGREPRYLELLFNSRNSNRVWIRRRWEISSEQSLKAPGSGREAIDQYGIARWILQLASDMIRLSIPSVAWIPFYGLGRSLEMEARAAELNAISLEANLTGNRALVAAVNALWATDTWGVFGEIINGIVQAVFDGRPEISRGRYGYRGVSWQVMSGTSASAGDTKVNSTELIYDASSRHYVDAISFMLGDAPRYRQSGYISVRYSRKSDALLSMHNVASGLAVSIEATLLHGLEHSEYWTNLIERRLGGIGRPHWGQQNSLRAADVSRLYGPKLRRWRDQLWRVCGFSPTFGNDYTVQRGLEVPWLPLTPFDILLWFWRR